MRPPDRRLGKALTLFGDGATALRVIEAALEQINRVLKLFRAAPGMGKAIQKVLDQVLDVARRMIPAVRVALGRASQAVSALNLTVVPGVRDLFVTSLLPIFQPLKLVTDSLLLLLGQLARQQALIELLLPPAYQKKVADAINRVEAFDRQLDAKVREIRQINAALTAFRAFLDTAYLSLSIKKVAIDTAKAVLEEIADAIRGLVDAVGDALPGWLKRAVEAVLDWVDSAIDWVLEKLADLLDWVGIDFRGFLRWIQDLKDRLGRELASLLQILDAIEKFLVPLAQFGQYLRSQVERAIEDAIKLARELEREALLLIQSLQGIRVGKALVELLIPGWLLLLRRLLEQIAKGRRGGLEALGRELERIDEVWGDRPAAPLDPEVVGRWALLRGDCLRLVADARGRSTGPIRARAAALAGTARDLHRFVQRRYGQALRSLPAGALQEPAGAEIALPSPATVRAAPDRSVADIAPKPANLTFRISRPSTSPEVIELAKLLADARRKRRPRGVLAPAQRRLESELRRLMAGPRPDLRPGSPRETRAVAGYR